MSEPNTAHHDVLAEDVQGPQAAVLQAGEHGRDGEAHGARQAGAAPRLLELRDNRGVVHLLVVLVHVGERSDVAGPLHVVLAAQRVQPGAGLADVAEEHLQVRQRHDVVRPGDVLGNAERVVDGSRFRLAEHPGHTPDQVSGNPRDLAGPLHRVSLDGLPDGLEALGVLLDELLIRPAPGDDLVHQPVDQRDVGADPVLDVDVRPPAQVDGPRVAHDQRRALLLGPLHEVRDDRVRLGGVGPDDQHHLGLLDLLDRVGHRS
jgi:hypothetical protein